MHQEEFISVALGEKKADLVIKNIGKLATMRSKNTPVVGKYMNNVEILEDAYVAIKDGIFIEIGVGEKYKSIIEVL